MIDIEKELEEKYELIKRLISEYNDLASEHEIASTVGCIISPSPKGENESPDDYYETYATSGWMPSSLFC